MGYRLRDVLAEVADGRYGQGASGDILDGLREWLVEVADDIAGAAPDAGVLRAPKGRIADVLACERYTLATLDRPGGAASEAQTAGMAVDRLARLHLAGARPGPNEDPVAAVAAYLRTDGDPTGAEDLEALAPEAAERLGELLGRAAEGLAENWGDIGPEWWPVWGERVGVVLGDGRVVLSAEPDLTLGWPPSTLPGVIVEVKSGRAWAGHRDDLFWYALLVGLRRGRAPAAVATWSADDGAVIPEPVHDNALEAAARRGVAALEALGALAAGRTPTARPGPRCGWCPHSGRCAEQAAAEAEREQFG